MRYCWWFSFPQQPPETLQNPRNNGINYQPQLVQQDFFHQHNFLWLVVELYPPLLKNKHAPHVKLDESFPPIGGGELRKYWNEHLKTNPIGRSLKKKITNKSSKNHTNWSFHPPSISPKKQKFHRRIGDFMNNQPSPPTVVFWPTSINGETGGTLSMLSMMSLGGS